MAKTPTDLAIAVMQDLRVLSAEETPSAADLADIKARYYDIVEELEYIGVLAIDPDAIPEAYFRPLAGVVAARCAAMFGREAMDETGALRALMRVTRKPYSGDIAELNTY